MIKTPIHVQKINCYRIFPNANSYKKHLKQHFLQKAQDLFPNNYNNSSEIKHLFVSDWKVTSMHNETDNHIISNCFKSQEQQNCQNQIAKLSESEYFEDFKNTLRKIIFNF